MRLSSKEQKSLQTVFRLSQEKLHHILNIILESYYEKDNVITTSKYIYAIGDIPIALVAHLDTVHLKPASNLFYIDSKKEILWSPDGLGADDRAGVFMILKILQSGRRPHIIFTTDEEKGCIGACALTDTVIEPFADIKYIIQLDRSGKDDCVFYKCQNKEFQTYIESFGFTTKQGSFSDISIIAPDWGIAAVNLSIGYYNEHTTNEILNVKEMFKTLSRVLKMLDNYKSAEKYSYITSIKDFIENLWVKNHQFPCEEEYFSF